MHPTDRTAPPGNGRAERLNSACSCRTLDAARLEAALERELGPLALADMQARPNLFSRVPVFLSSAEVRALRAVVEAVEAVVRNPAYQAAALACAPEIARRDFGPRGVFMGYDFHLTADGPRLIEVNTNAGGAFLNALLAEAQRACCQVEGVGVQPGEAARFPERVLQMFDEEWRLQGRPEPLRRIAIVDDDPTGQHLFPEFLAAQALLRRGGWDVLIADPGDLAYRDGRLLADSGAVDLVYNRIVDFALEEARHEGLRKAYIDGAVVVTPNPHVHALFADKRNLVLLSDRERLAGWGVGEDRLRALEAVPATVEVTPANAEALWQDRKRWFFKPIRGHGSRGVYRGEKLTTRVWGEISRGGYVAQAFAPPSERQVDVDGVRQARKVDVRLYTYDGEVLLSAARLYQGQATNLRTPGGGFAPLFVV